MDDTLANEAAEALQLFYEAPRNRYWQKIGDDFSEVTETNALRLLIEAGFDGTRPRTGGVSPAERQLLAFQRSRRVVFVGSLPGYRPGLQQVNHKPALVTDGPYLIEPKAGDWPTIQEFLESLLCDLEHNQIDRFLTWLQESAADLYAKRLSTHLALVLVGSVNCGKTQLKEQVIVPVLGGRQAQPFSFLQGKTDFNADLFDAEVLVIDDETSSAEWRQREALKARLKILTATGQHRHHPKFGKAIVVRTYWRVVMACNDDGNNLLVLPAMEKSIRDKILMLRCQRASVFEGVTTAAAREELGKRIAGELPAFLHWLLNEYRPPEDLPRERFGVAGWQHPDPVDKMYDLSTEAEYHGIICTTLFPSVGTPFPWEGTQAELKAVLYADQAARAQLADVIGRGVNSCRALLNNLADKFPRHFIKSPHTRRGVVWSIYPPEKPAPESAKPPEETP